MVHSLIRIEFTKGTSSDWSRDDAKENEIERQLNAARIVENPDAKKGGAPAARLPTIDPAPHGRVWHGFARELGLRLLVHLPSPDLGPDACAARLGGHEST